MRDGRRWSGALAGALVAAALAVPVASGPAAAADPPVRILLLGDSMTQGSAGDWTWRYRLWNHLTEHDVLVDFVGYRTDLRDEIGHTFGNQDYVDPAFDRDHAARWGMKLGALDVPVADLVEDYQPDVLVTMLGDNDLTAGASAQETADLLEGLVAAARTADPGLDIVLATDPRPTYQQHANAYNDLVRAMVADLDTPASPVALADAAAGYTEPEDDYDGAHPNSRGELKIAAAVADGLSALGVGPPAERPLPVVPRGPRIPPVLTAAPAPDGADLSWVRSPGAQESEVWRRDATAGTAWQLVAEHVTGTTYSASGLVSGHRFQFQTRPSKGFWIAQPDAWSNVAEVVGPPTHVMLLGDSNTIGSTGDWTWRYRLWKHLAATAPGQVDLVGPRTDLYDRATRTYGHQQYVDPAFDRDHAGVWGSGVIFPATPTQQLVATHGVDTLVEMLGVNDLLRLSVTPDDVAAAVRALVANARSANPDVDVVLGEVPQTWVGGAVELNALLHGIAADLDTAGARVVVAETADGFDRTLDTYDNSHANARGELKLAAAVADALAQVDVGGPAARPLPVVPVGPRIRVTARGTVRDGKAKLKWTGSPGADGYRVLVRRPARTRTWHVAGTVTHRRLTVRGLKAGQRYEFVVLPAKGRDVAATDVRSNRVSVRV